MSKWQPWWADVPSSINKGVGFCKSLSLHVDFPAVTAIRPHFINASASEPCIKMGGGTSKVMSFSEIQRSSLFCTNIVKKDPGRARQKSLATAGTNFTKHGAQNNGDLCTCCRATVMASLAIILFNDFTLCFHSMARNIDFKGVPISILNFTLSRSNKTNFAAASEVCY